MEISKKVILLGKFGVGKTSLIKKWVYQKFSEEYLTTIGVKVDKKQINIHGLTLTMLIWDIAGPTPNQKIPQSYMMGSHGVLLVFDLSRPSSYEDLQDEIAAVRDYLPEVPIQPVGNKVDLLAKSSIRDVEESLPLENVIYTSAKTGENVNVAFQSLGEAILR